MTTNNNSDLPTGSSASRTVVNHFRTVVSPSTTVGTTLSVSTGASENTAPFQQSIAPKTSRSNNLSIHLDLNEIERRQLRAKLGALLQS